MTPERIHEYRKRAVAWLEYACQGNPGLDSPRHLEIKEGRRVKGYSSCGDLAHWLWFRLGVRLPWLNREEHLGWTPGVNVSRIVAHSSRYESAEPLHGGDVIVIANVWPAGYDAHVVCIVDQPSLSTICTAESGLPGNGLQTRALPMARRIRTVARLSDVLEAAEAAGLLYEGVQPAPEAP